MPDLVGVGLVDVEPPRLAAPSRARLTEAGRCRHRDSGLLARPHFELVPLGDGALVRVSREDQLGARVDQCGENVVATRNRLLPRPPRCADHLVVHDDDTERPRRCVRELLCSRQELGLPEATRLLPPRPRGVEADDVEQLRPVHRLRRSPHALEASERRPEARGVVGHIVVSGHREHRGPERAQEPRGMLVLRRPAAMSEVAARDHECRCGALDEAQQRLLHKRVFARARMQVGNVDHADGHGRSTL
jgi:hypothetical protein